MEFIAVVKGLVVFVGGIVLLYGAKLAWAIRKADSTEYKISNRLTGSIKNAYKGNVKPYHDGVRDYRVKAGLAIDVKSNAWIQQGAISKESIRSVFN